MELNKEIISDYINYFFSNIVGFKNQEYRYISIGQSNSEFLSIAMDKVDRLTRKSGRLRTRVWSNCYFIFHDHEIEPTKVYKDKVTEIKKNYPFLFIRSYVYFIFINISKEKQTILPLYLDRNIETRDYKIWVFNSKYELKEETKRKNLFGITLDENEIIDDYIYLAKPDSELKRMEAANSDAIDCVRAFTGDLKLLEQTREMLDAVRSELINNPNARIILEGPARSGKTIIAASLLGEYKDSKFLLMNYFFYQAIIDGFHALTGWSNEEIEELVKNSELDLLLDLRKALPKSLKKISANLKYAVRECDFPRSNSKTKKLLIENISELIDKLEKLGFGHRDIFVLKPLMNLHSRLINTNDKNQFVHFNKNELLKLQDQIDGLLSGKYDALINLQKIIVKSIEELISNSKQKFFHHNINKKISSKLKDGCWIERGNPTISKMWTKNYQPKLIICDEVQRLGVIPKFEGEFVSYDEFDEVEQILIHSNQSFFTGDDFQMLNSKYDKGIKRISDMVQKNGETLIKCSLPESVGIPAEICTLMKYLTNPQAVPVNEVVRIWKEEKGFEITFIKNNANKLISLFDKDRSNKKHLASPADYGWLSDNEKIEIKTHHRDKPIILLTDHEKKNFAYRFPYFCNEEVMPNYMLSAYELISRELESLYVHIPYFKNMNPDYCDWYRKHLYVLFTRPTLRLVVNFEVKEEYIKMKRMVKNLQYKSAKIFVNFLE